MLSALVLFTEKSDSFPLRAAAMAEIITFMTEPTVTTPKDSAVNFRKLPPVMPLTVNFFLISVFVTSRPTPKAAISAINGKT